MLGHKPMVGSLLERQRGCSPSRYKVFDDLHSRTLDASAGKGVGSQARQSLIPRPTWRKKELTPTSCLRISTRRHYSTRACTHKYVSKSKSFLFCFLRTKRNSFSLGFAAPGWTPSHADPPVSKDDESIPFFCEIYISFYKWVRAYADTMSGLFHLA